MAGDGGEQAGARRQDAIKLAKGSKWDELRRLVDAEPAAAQQVDSYGMLPLHWACTEPQAVGEPVLLALLKAHPQGARSPNTADMLPLHIAVKAQARIEWLQALLASYPDAVTRKAPTGENAVVLARKSKLPERSQRLLEDMYHHVCDKLGVDDELADGGAQLDDVAPPPPVSSSQSLTGQSQLPVRSSGGYQALRRASSTDSMRMRTLSDNEFFQTHYMSAANASVSSSGSSIGGSVSATSGAMPSPVTGPPPPMSAPVSLSSGPRPTTNALAAATARGVVALPPRWMNAPNCHICAQKFGTFKKRHHCRNCGQSICSDHSAREKMKLPHYGLSDRHRVCTVCHDLLRNARRQQQHQRFQGLPPNQQQVNAAAPPPALQRRSDEAMRSPPAPQSAQQLERHVSAPARHTAGTDGGGENYRVMHDQVALLQQQVSKLMEEKEAAERQLRAQAEMLEEALDPDRLTNLSGRDTRSSTNSGGSAGSGNRRDRLNSYPVKLPSATGAAAGASTSEQQQQLARGTSPMYRSTGHMNPSTTNSNVDRRLQSNGSFRQPVDVDIDIDGPMFASAPLGAQQQPQQTYTAQQLPPAFASGNGVEAAGRRPGAMTGTRGLEDEFTNISFVESTYEDSDAELDAGERPTDLADFHDADADKEVEVVAGEESADEYLIDEDDEDEDEEQQPEVTVLVHLGHAMLDKGSNSAAAQAFARAVEICPTDANLHALLGRAYYADENLDDAVAALTRSLDLEPSATNSTLLGKILFEKGDHEKAIEAYQRSLTMQK